MTQIDRLQFTQLLLELMHKLNEPLELDAFLQTVIALAGELTGSEVASILEYDESSESLRFVAAPWFQSQTLLGMEVPIQGSVAGRVFQENQPIIVHDTAREKKHFKAVDQKLGFQTRSLLAVPLTFKGQVIGVLEALNKADGANYTGEDVTILETLATLTAMFMHDAALDQHVQNAIESQAELDRLKSDFIAITSHELRTPLGVILGHATFLREIIGEEHHEQLDIVIRNATRLKEIIENLSNVDNYQSGVARIRRRSISITRIVKEVSESFIDIAKQKGVALRVDVSKGELLVEGDANKIATALGNLIKNALTFTDSGGHVFVVADHVPGYVKVSVIDDGIGIPSQDLPRIFDRFYQVESHLTRRHGGMGLGLAVSKVMIELHGGRIWAESVEGKGSNFTILLPLNSEQATAGERVFNSE